MNKRTTILGNETSPARKNTTISLSPAAQKVSAVKVEISLACSSELSIPYSVPQSTDAYALIRKSRPQLGSGEGKERSTDAWERELSDLGRFPLLTEHEEVILAFHRMQLDALIQKMEEAESSRNGASQHLDELRHAQKLRRNIIGVFVECNRRLVLSICNKRFSFSPLVREEAYLSGCMGLMKAAERFEPGRSAKFATYASWWIRQTILSDLAKHSKTIRVPPHVTTDIKRLQKLSRELQDEIGAPVSVETLAAAAGMSCKRAQEILTAANPVVSLNALIGDGEAEFGSLIADERAEVASEVVAGRDRVQEALDLIDTELNDQERLVLEARFGLNGARERTLADIGREYGVTRERIRQIQITALKKLRNALGRREHLTPRMIAAGRGE